MLGAASDPMPRRRATCCPMAPPRRCDLRAGDRRTVPAVDGSVNEAGMRPGSRKDPNLSHPLPTVTPWSSPPATLSPSKVSSFKDCALAFRFSAIDRLPEPPSIRRHAGHARAPRPPAPVRPAEPPSARSTRRSPASSEAIGELRDRPRVRRPRARRRGGGGVPRRGRAARARATSSSRIRPRSTRSASSCRLEARVGDLRLRGIIDRLELDADGELVVTDYKTGRAPASATSRAGSAASTSTRSSARSCSAGGRRRSSCSTSPIRGHHHRARPSSRPVGCERKVGAIWTAVERACEREDFRPRPGPLCAWCSFQAFCPAFGGDPAAARAGRRRSTPVATLAVRPDRSRRPARAQVAASC